MRHLRVVTDDDWTDLEAQAESLDHECPHCGAPSGHMCIGKITGQPMRAVHWQRISAARAAMASGSGVSGAVSGSAPEVDGWSKRSSTMT